MGTRYSVALYVHCLSCKFSYDLIQDKLLRNVIYVFLLYDYVRLPRLRFFSVLFPQL
jgi:hypothetical protein